MSNMQSQAVALADETLHRLAYRLNVVCKKWGAEDYPADKGMALRNKMLLFGDWMLYLFTQGCSESPEVPNEWLHRNTATFLKMDSEEFVRCIGLARIYMQAFLLQMHLGQESVGVYGDASIKQKLAVFGKQLDWIYSAHDVPVEWAQEAHRLLVTHIDDGEDYAEASKQWLGGHLVKTSLGWSEAASPEMWDRWIVSADMSSLNQLESDPVEAQRFCERVFSQF